MMRLTEEEKKSLYESSESLNFLLEEQIEKVKSVEIFYEDCEKCSESKNCPSRDEFEEGGLVLKKMHEFLQDKGVESTIHPMTFEDREEVGKMVSEKGGVLPVIACFDLEKPVFSQRHNYFYIEMEDERRLLYLLQVDLLKEVPGVDKERMIYG